MNNVYLNIGDRIRTLRGENNETLKELAKNINYDFSNLSKIERGTRGIDPVLLKKIATYYNVNVGYLFGEELRNPRQANAFEVEWVELIEELKQENLTPKRVKKYIKIVQGLEKELL